MQIFPSSFPVEYRVNQHVIRYLDFVEVAQGGPEVAALAVDGMVIGDGSLFGGPPAFFENQLFAPRRLPGLGSYFRLTVADMVTGAVRDFGESERLILISKVDHAYVYYFTDIANRNLKMIRWK